MRFSLVISWTTAMHPSKSVSSDSTSAPLASGCTSCAIETLSFGSSTTAGMPAAAQYEPNAAEVSPVEEQAAASIGTQPAIIWLKTDTRTVMPRSLNDPVCELPHCLIHRSSTCSCLPKRSAHRRLELPSYIDTMFSLSMKGTTHSFFPHTPDPYGYMLRR